MRLFVIGNGFDLAHGLPTRYWDFREYLNNNYCDFLYDFEQHYGVFPGLNDSEKKNILWNEFETNLATIDEDIIIEDAESLDMYLESGDIGIEDTLYEYFTEEYQYIDLLSVYLKRWIRTIKLRDVLPRTTYVNKDDLYINFNYTSLLENVYNIPLENVIHIHGSLRKNYDDPIIGHGNYNRIEMMEKRIISSQDRFDEKETSICKVIKEYYEKTLKNVNNRIPMLSRIEYLNFIDIFVVGHSLSGVDIPYFRYMDVKTSKKLNWNIVFYKEEEIIKMRKSLKSMGISNERINLIPAIDFYNM